jgi:hypothetical protein
MSEGQARVLDYLGYKNKIRTRQWEERLWRQHLEGSPEDVRAVEEQQRYLALLARADQVRALAERLHQRRAAHAPQFASNWGEAPPEQRKLQRFREPAHSAIVSEAIPKCAPDHRSAGTAAG